MERHVKERLVGAAVLMAAAIILVPEMLSGPPREKPAGSPQVTGETPVKTYTIDLSKSPAAQAQLSDEMPATGAPPAEVPPQQAAARSTAIEPAGQAEAESPDVKIPAPAGQPPAAVVAQDRAPSPAPVAQPPSATAASVAAPMKPSPPLASGASAPRSGNNAAWAVQLGSFASKATADRLAADVLALGESAFVMPVKSGANTLYRVRVGPWSTKTGADAALRKVKGKYSSATVVTHP